MSMSYNPSESLFIHFGFSEFQFIDGCQIEMTVVRAAMRSLLLNLGDYRNLNLNVIQRLSSLTQLFPHTFNEKLCEQLMVSSTFPSHVQKLFI